MIQLVVSWGAAVAREVFCCARGCLFCSALPRAVPLLCARVLFAIECRLKGRSKARKQHPGVGFLFRCTKSENFRLALVFMHYATCIQIYCTSSIPDGGTLKPSWRFCGDRRVRGGVGIPRPPCRAFHFPSFMFQLLSKKQALSRKKTAGESLSSSCESSTLKQKKHAHQSAVACNAPAQKKCGLYPVGFERLIPGH